MFIAQLIKKLSGLFSLSFITTAIVTTTFFYLSLAHFSRAFMVNYHWKIVRNILFRSDGAEIFYRLSIPIGLHDLQRHGTEGSLLLVVIKCYVERPEHNWVFVRWRVNVTEQLLRNTQYRGFPVVVSHELRFLVGYVSRRDLTVAIGLCLSVCLSVCVHVFIPLCVCWWLNLR